MIISHNATKNLSSLIDSTIMLKLGEHDTPTLRSLNKTEIIFDDHSIDIWYDGLIVLTISTIAFDNGFRFLVTKGLDKSFFYTPDINNNKGGYRLVVTGLLDNEIENITLQDKCKEDDWHSTAFQYSTLYDNNIPNLLLIEPYISEVLEKFSTFYRVTVYTISESWTDLPFDYIQKEVYDILEIYQ